MFHNVSGLVSTTVRTGPNGTTTTVDGSSARASADRPSPSNRLISPNRSPGPISATSDSRPSIERLAIAIRPAVTR